VISQTSTTAIYRDINRSRWKETKPSWNESLRAGAMDSSLTVTHIKALDKGLKTNVSAAVVDYINALSQTKRE